MNSQTFLKVLNIFAQKVHCLFEKTRFHEGLKRMSVAIQTVNFETQKRKNDE